jgi:hypothetical protein
MNPVQFSSTNPTRPSIKTSNFYIGTSGPYGPTSVTDFYSGITPPSGEYTVYQDKPTLGPSIRIFDGTTIIPFLKSLGYITTEDRKFQQTFQTASYTNDICVMNKDLEAIVPDIRFHMDAGFSPCLVSSSQFFYSLGPDRFEGRLYPDTSSGSMYSEDNGGYVSVKSSNSSYIETDYSSPTRFQSEFSLSFWTYLSGSQGADTRLFSKSGGTGFGVIITSDKVKVRVASDTADFTSAGTLNTNSWNNIVINCEALQTSVSINNGTLRTISRLNTNLSTITSTNNVILGSLGGTTNFLNGGIATVSMYQRILKSDEIDQNWNVFKDRFGL